MSTHRIQRALARLERIPGGVDVAEELLEDWAEQAEDGAKAYDRFHWGEPADELVDADAAVIVPGDVVVELGELIEVVYETSKGGELFDWQHEFGEDGGERPTLAHVADTRGNSKSPSLVIVGGDYKVTARGIIG